ncbi:hypothetical protein FRB99_001428, partial [Tulasnella sp. 403]
MEARLDASTPYPGDPAGTQLTPGRFHVDLFLDDLIIADSAHGNVVGFPMPPVFIHDFEISALLQEFYDLQWSVNVGPMRQLLGLLTVSSAPGPMFNVTFDSDFEDEVMPVLEAYGETWPLEQNYDEPTIMKPIGHEDGGLKASEADEPETGSSSLTLEMKAMYPAKGMKSLPNAEKVIDNIEQNVAKLKDFDRLVLKGIVVNVKVNGQEARALIDS